MDTWCAPQWADFTCSPQVPSDNYFNEEHEVHEPQIYLKTKVQSQLSLPFKKKNINQSINDTKFEDSLESEFPPSNNAADFTPHDNKKHSVEETPQENQLSNAVKYIKLDERSSKIHQTWSVSITELTSAFKVTKAEHKVKTAAPERIKTNTCMLTKEKSSLKNVQTNDIKKQNNFTNIKNEPVTQSRNDVLAKKLSHKIVSHPQIQPNSFKTNRRLLGKSPKVLTCIKNRRKSGQFVSLAEAVHKYQSRTPQRFRTLNSKELKPGAVLKLKRSPLKLTYPVSPALRCKQRARKTTILNQQVQEKSKLEKIDKNQIKTNPIPANTLKAPSVLKKVDKNLSPIAEESHLTQSKKVCRVTRSNVNLQQNTNDEKHKQVAPITRSVSASNVAVKKENVQAVRFSFEIRNKEFLMKKEEKLKNLHVQETNKIKTEFRARPAPKFSKQANPTKEQNTKRRTIVQCPFSFEERNKSLAKKKEELVKQLQDANKKVRVFRANPGPSCIPVNGLSTENLQSKEKSDAYKRCANVANCKSDKKQVKTNVNVTDTTNKKLNAPQKNIIKFELNTDKRAKERSEFDKKMKKREEELKAKKLEEEKSKLLNEKLERAEFRKMAEVKARPMPVYKCMVISKSTKPPTSPRSPALGYRPK